MIPKAGHDTQFLKNWRPIILLGIDYKLLAKAIANRIKPLLQNIIHPDQTGFVASRKIQHNIRHICDTITLAKQKKIEGFLLSLDFEKAFDRVEYRSLLGAMKHFNFGPKMRIARIAIL